jgi:hypothetical protein
MKPDIFAYRRAAEPVLAIAALLSLAAAPVLAQKRAVKSPKIPANLVIYRGDSLQTSGVSLASWGSGTVDEDKSKIFSGTESLKITTHGMYQGASLMFNKPVNLAPFLSGKFNYLTVTVLPPATNANGAPEGGSPGFGSFPGYGGKGLGSGGLAGLPGGGSSPGFGGQGSGAYGGIGRSGQVQTQKGRKIENLRLVMATTGGKTLEVMLPLANATEENEWKNLAVPLSAIPNLVSDDAQIKEIRVFGDAPGTINIGSIGIVEDPTPITIDTINDKTVQRLSKYQYLASANAGVTPLVYTWDWDASDGIQDETEGRNVTHAFRKASADDNGKSTDFVVTVTVSDLYKMKAPVTTTFKVHVTP